MKVRGVIRLNIIINEYKYKFQKDFKRLRMETPKKALHVS